MLYHQPHNSMSNYTYNAYFYESTIYAPHFHKNFEVIYVLDGAVDCVINNTAYTLTKGQFGLCLAYDIHAYTPQENTRYWVAVFSGDHVHAFEKQMMNKTGAGFRFSCREETLDFLKNYLINDSKPSLYMLKACLYALCEEYLQTVEVSQQDNKKNIIMREIVDFVSENSANKISLSDVAERLGYDYHYISRYFHKIFNMPFCDFLNLYRLERASELLTNTDMKIAEIALESGFQSVRSFNDRFKTAFDKTPSQYRKSLNG